MRTLYRYKYAIAFLNVGIKLLNTDMKETKNGHTGNLVEQHDGFIFRMDRCISYDVLLFLF